MDLPLALHELAARHRLDAPALRRLGQLAGLEQAHEALSRWLPRGVAALAAVLLGSGLVFWVAANWDLLGRVGQFALLQAAVVLAIGATLWRGLQRLPAALLALLGIGGLFAYFGQTYQTGADAWQLFALWAALAVPLGLALRSDLLWSAWVLVAMTAIALWLQAHISPGFETQARDLPIWLTGWSGAVLLAVLMSPPIGGRLGAGKRARRVAVAFATVLVAGGALFGLFQSPVAWPYPIGLLLLAAAAAQLYRARSFDLALLGFVALALDVLLLAGLSRGLYQMDERNVISQMLLITVASALLLSLTVKLVLQRARAVQQESHHV
ncbi:conserved hypothetical protein [Leptothrix cholodnii SP-6]|uniref:DUF2157 domain-containing protein n=1 Tax=Leptothrix cholodnii (strain ATCC 51168 / LMG 8142 / SP-6) TaxID=395495 RepID=B1XZD5_LEPCP|nr:DUF2157 domain-containing protein [Leptothrix cholodnii]ACB36498.1 conserved hypothetical protein [Leptothrix cholodnii SP-6]